MHNLKIEIDESIKEQVYQYAGFGFSNSQLSDKELNYENVFKAIDPGPVFNEICEDIELDTNITSEYIKKYVLHLIVQDVTNLKYPSKRTLKKLKEEEIRGQTIEDIIDEIFFKTPKDLFNTLSYIEEDYFTADQIEAKLYKEYEYVDWNENILTTESKRKWMGNSKKTGSFYRPYVKYATKKSRESQSLVKPFNKITDFDQELLNKQMHFNRFIKALELAEFDPSQDVWSFEYSTFLFMLQKISSYKNIDDLDKEYFPVLASFLIVGDIRFKLLLMDTIFKNDSFSHYKNKLSELFLLSFVIIPFFKDFIEYKLMGLIPESVLKSKSSIDIEYNDMKLVNLKKQLYIYQILKTENCYRGASVASEFGINIKPGLTVTDGVKTAWKHIEQASGTITKEFNNLFQKFLNHLGDFEPLLDFKKWVEVGVFEVTQEYRTVMKNNISSLETKDLSDFKNFIGKTDDATKKIKLHFEGNRQMNQKKLNKIIGKELAQLGIDINKLKEISRKYNCSITIEPENIINKTIS